MFIVYSILIRIYGLAIAISSIFSPKARSLYKGRNEQYTRIKQKVEEWHNHKIIWIHAASYGEYEMSIPIIQELTKSENVAIVVSFHSPSGYENIILDDSNILKIYLPLDIYSDQQELIRLIRPDKVLFIKYEFWFNLLRVLIDEKIPFYYTSLHLNADSYLFKKTMQPFLELIKQSSRIYCHNASSQTILISNGFKNTEIFGDTRLHQVIENKKTDKGKVNWQTQRPVIGLGSLQKEECTYFSNLINSNSDINFIIAPHEIDQKSINGWQNIISDPLDKYSNKPDSIGRILLVDTMGDLKYLYRNCQAAYIGGGFRKGPHNILEPLVYGIPVCTGPNIKKFPMALELSRKGFIVSVPEIEGVELVLKNLLRIDRSRFMAATENFVSHNQAQILPLISELLS